MHCHLPFASVTRSASKQRTICTCTGHSSAIAQTPSSSRPFLWCVTLPFHPHSCRQTVANRLGLPHRPIRGSAVTPILHGGRTLPLRALTEPLTIQLLAGPGNVAFALQLPVVLAVPSHPRVPGSNLEIDPFELQLGLFDFCQEVDFDWLPLWASQFTHLLSGYSWALPVVVPQPRQYQLWETRTSTFHITQECYEEVRVVLG